MALQVIALVTGLLAALALPGCAARQGSAAGLPPLPAAAGGQAAPLKLPAPSALHAAAYTSAGLSQWGSQYQDALPHGRVSRDGDLAVFAPDWSGPAGKFADLAHAIYRFELADYQLESKLHFSWMQVGPIDDAWLGLANFVTDSWDWQPLAATGGNIFNPARHVAETGELYAVVLLTGTAPWRLERIYIGVSDGWPMWGHDARHTFQSPAVGPSTDQVKWQVRTVGGGFRHTDAAVDADGAIYFGAGPNLYALNPDGALKWIVECCYPTEKPVVASDGTILICSDEDDAPGGILIAYNADGSRRWSLDCDIVTAPVAGPDGDIYALAYDGLAALHTDGSLKWQFNVSSYPVSRICAVRSDGTVYFGNTELVICLSAAGEQQWTYDATPSSIGSLAIGPDGSVYAAGFWDGVITCLQPDGSFDWKYSVGEQYHALEDPPVFLPDGTLVVATGATVTAIHPDGSSDWTYPLEGEVRTPLAISETGVIYISTRNQNGPLYALNSDGSLQWTASAGELAPAIGKDGNIYVESAAGFTALHPNGMQAWARTTGDTIATPVIGYDGTVYAKTEEVLHAIDLAGEIQWTHPVSGYPLAVNSTGMVLVGSSPVYAVDPSGDLVWEQDIQTGTLTIASDDRAYFSAYDGFKSLSISGAVETILNRASNLTPTISPHGWLYLASGDLFLRLYPDGSTWTQLLQGKSVASIGQDGTTYVCTPEGLVALRGEVLWTCEAPNLDRQALGPDGTIFAGNAGLIMAVSAAGAVKWTHEIRGLSNMAIDAAGVVYAGSDAGLLALRDASDHVEAVWTFAAERAFGAPAIGPDGSIIVGCENGQIYAIGPGGG